MRSLFLLSLGVASLGKASGDSLLSWLSALAPENHEGAVESHVFQEWDVNDEEESNVIANLSEELPLADLPADVDVDQEQRARGLKRRHRVLSPSSPSGSAKAPAKPPSPKKKKAKGPASPSAPNAPSAPGGKKKKKKKAPAPGSDRRRRH